MENIIVREPKIEEYEDVVKVMNSEVHYWNKSVFTQEELDMFGSGKDTIEDWLEDRDGGKGRHLVAIMGGKIVGSLRWYIKPNNVGWVNRSATLPEYYRRGVGRALNQEVERQAKELGLAALAKETQKRAEWAVKFHLANGYKILTQEEVDKPPFKGLFSKPIVEFAYVFGKKAEDFCK